MLWALARATNHSFARVQLRSVPRSQRHTRQLWHWEGRSDGGHDVVWQLAEAGRALVELLVSAVEGSEMVPVSAGLTALDGGRDVLQRSAAVSITKWMTGPQRCGRALSRLNRARELRLRLCDCLDERAALTEPGGGGRR